MGDAAHRVAVADGHSSRVDVAGQYARQYGGIHPHGGVAGVEAFLLNDAFLFLDVVRKKEQPVGKVGEHEAEAVEQRGPCGGHARELVAGVVEAGGCIDIASEAHTVGGQHIDNAAAREVAGAVKGHVLKKVCVALFVVLFVDGAYTVHEPALGHCRRFGAVAHIVGHASGQCAEAQGGVGGQCTGCGEEWQCGAEQQREQALGERHHVG